MLGDFANYVSISVLISFLKVLSDIIPREVDQNIFVLGGVGIRTLPQFFRSIYVLYIPSDFSTTFIPSPSAFLMDRLTDSSFTNPGPACAWSRLEFRDCQFSVVKPQFPVYLSGNPRLLK